MSLQLQNIFTFFIFVAVQNNSEKGGGREVGM